MNLWDWQSFWGQFSPPVLVASFIVAGVMTVLGAIALKLKKHGRDVLFVLALGSAMFLFLGFSLSMISDANVKRHAPTSQ